MSPGIRPVRPAPLSSRRPARSAGRLSGVLAAAALAASAACATPSGSASSGGTNVLTRAELLETNMPTLYDAIQQTRPQWLQARGQSRIGRPAEVLVFIDDAPAGGVEVLRGWRSQDVADVRFLTASDAATRYGTTAESGGVLVVRTR